MKITPNGFTKTILLLYHTLLSARICPLSYFWLVKSMQDIKGNVNFTLFQSSSDNSSVQSSTGARNPVHVPCMRGSRTGRRGTMISSESVRKVIICLVEFCASIFQAARKVYNYFSYTGLFRKTRLFKPKEFKNAGFAFYIGQQTF